MQRVVVIYYRRFGTTYWSYLSYGFLAVEDEIDGLSRNVGNKMPLLCLTLQKNAVLKLFKVRRLQMKIIVRETILN